MPYWGLGIDTSDAAGNPVRGYVVENSEADALEHADPGEIAVLWDNPYIEKPPVGWRMRNGEIVFVQPPLSVTLQQTADFQINNLIQRKDMGCPWDGSHIPTTEQARNEINTFLTLAVAAKLSNGPFTHDQVTLEGTVRTLDADQFISMATAVASYIAACTAAYRAVVAQILACTSLEQLGQIDYIGGYPSYL